MGPAWGKYKIFAETFNKQIWVIEFKGLDSDNQQLVAKNFIVRKQQ
jgi:hypothetical protein